MKISDLKNLILRHKTKIPLLVYWIIILVLTHIPIPKVVRQAHVSDKSLHLMAYMLLAFFLWLAITPNKKLSFKKPALWLILLISCVYGFLDEWLQLYVGRNANFDDFLADLLGALIAVTILSIMRAKPAFLAIVAIVIFMLKNLARTNLSQLMPEVNLIFHFAAFAFFTTLWIMYVENLLRKPTAPAIKFLTSLLPPAIFVFAVALSAKYFHRHINTTEILISLAGVLAASLALTLFKHFTKPKLITS